MCLAVSFRLLIVSFLLSAGLNSQTDWEMTWGPNQNRVDYLHKADGLYYMTGVNVCYKSVDAYHWNKLNLPTPNWFNFQLYPTSSGKRIFIAGIATGVLHSDDQGGTWVSDSISAPWSIYTLGNEVYVGTYSTLYYSIDSGDSWQSWSVPFGLVRGITRFKGDLYIHTQDGGIHKRDTANNSWMTINAWGTVGIGSNNVNNTLYNDNDQMFYITSYGNLFRTPSEYSSLLDITPTNCGWIHKYRVINNEIFICANSVYKSNKGFISWNEILRVYKPHDIFVGDGAILVGSQHGLFKKSIQKGTWEKLFYGIDPCYVYSMRLVGKHIWADGGVTTDLGASWTSSMSDTMHFTFLEGGIALGFARDFSSTIYFSSDSGITWHRSAKDGFFMAAHKKAIFNFSSDSIFRSLDFGKTFHFLQSFGFLSFVSLENDIFIMKTDGSLHKSDDNGLTWTNVSTPLQVHVPESSPFGAQAFLVPSSNALLYGTPENKSYISFDHGSTWSTLPEKGLDISLRTSWALLKDRIFCTGYTPGKYPDQIRKGIFQLMIGDSVWTVLNNDTTIATDFILAVDNYLFMARNGVERFKLFDSPAGTVYPLDRHNVTIFPNPIENSQNLTIEASYPIYKVECYESTGRIYRILSPSQNTQKIEIDLASIPPGVYYLKSYSEKETKVFKLLIQGP